MKYFTVVGSKTLRRNSKYQVAVTSHGYETPEILSIEIAKEDQTADTDKYEKVVTLSGSKTEIVQFDLKNQEVGNYFLVARSSEGEKIEKRVNLHLNSKKCSAFVQTDKSIYKPSDKIQFRVLLLDIDTKPLESSNAEIFITDGAQNRVKQFTNPAFKKGIFQDELELSDSPVMGPWMIHVKVPEASYEMTKEFEVAEYVLPKFEVIIESNPHVAYNEGKIRATVSGKYTFGKLAKGKATVTAKMSDCWYYCRGPGREVLVVKTVDIDGKKDVEFDLKKELKLNEIDNDVQVAIEATFTEELTGRDHTKSTNVTIHKTPHKIEVVTSNQKIKPGLPFKVTAFVKTHNGAPVSDAANSVEFYIKYFIEIEETDKKEDEPEQKGYGFRPNFGFHRPERTEEKTEKSVLKDGEAELDIEIPPKTIRLFVEVNYLSTQESIHISKAESESKQFLQAKVSTDKPKIGSEVSIEVQATEDLTSITYELLARSNVIASATLPVSNAKVFKFNFIPTPEMLPRAKIIIYYIRPDGEIISDQVKIDFGFELPNFVKLDLSADQSKPGEMLNITVNSLPNSFVGLLGVDQSVLLLKSGNDIEKSTVIEDMERYNEVDHYNSSFTQDYYNLRYENFEMSDAAVITNAKREYQPPVVRMMCYKTTAPMERAMTMHDSVPMQAMAFGASNLFGAPEAMPQVGGGYVDLTMDTSKVEIRTEFPETWIFDSLDLENGQSVLSKKVPDTITSWLITGFAINSAAGLGLTTQPSKLNVFQPFFVTTNLPYSIKRGEVVSIPVIVFNYLESDQNVEVTLFNADDEFEFAEKEAFSHKNQVTKTVIAKPNVGSSVSFTIKPKKVGNIKIKVVAQSAVAGDGVEQLLLVEPEGITQFMNKAFFVDLRNTKEFKTKFTIDIPKNAVPDSTKIEVSAIGDILGPTIDNLDKLIRIPYGCGEQNMLNFVPNIIILEYLKVLNKLTPEIALKAKKYMETGYQRELTYKHSDGSYSAFGQSDRSGSTWLTAFVAKSFHQASKHIQIEADIIKQALEFLSKVQDKDGSFPEVGTVFHTDMQGGSSKGLGLTAYVLLTFLENQSESNKYQKTIGRAIEYIVKNSGDLDDNYSLAIVSYALQLAKQGTLKDIILQKLEEKADSTNSMKHWAKPVSKADEKNPWNNQPNAVNIEMTAYALHAYIEAGKDTEAVPIMKWLVTQRNENGGFQSTQDTVVGLQALAKLASKIYVPDSEIEVVMTDSKGSTTKLSVNAANSLVLQKHELLSSAREFEVEATGHGFSIVQLSYKYNVSESSEWPRFILEPKVTESSNKNLLNLTVSTNFVADGSSQKSNMAVMEVSFPSGFIFDADHLNTLKNSAKVKRVETKDGETVVMIYFDDVDTNKLVLDFKAVRTHDVADLKPASVLIYDYYDNSRRASTFYNSPVVSLNEIEVN